MAPRIISTGASSPTARPRSGSITRRSPSLTIDTASSSSPRAAPRGLERSSSKGLIDPLEKSASMKSLTSSINSRSGNPVGAASPKAASSPNIVRKGSVRPPATGGSISPIPRSPQAPPKSPSAATRSVSPKEATAKTNARRLNGYGTPLQSPRMAPDAPKVETVAARLARKRWQLAMRVVSTCNDLEGPRKPRSGRRFDSEGRPLDDDEMSDDELMLPPTDAKSPGGETRTMHTATGSDCSGEMPVNTANSSECDGGETSPPLSPGEAPLGEGEWVRHGNGWCWMQRSGMKGGSMIEKDDDTVTYGEWVRKGKEWSWVQRSGFPRALGSLLPQSSPPLFPAEAPQGEGEGEWVKHGAGWCWLQRGSLKPVGRLGEDGEEEEEETVTYGEWMRKGKEWSWVQRSGFPRALGSLLPSASRDDMDEDDAQPATRGSSSSSLSAQRSASTAGLAGLVQLSCMKCALRGLRKCIH